MKKTQKDQGKDLVKCVGDEEGESKMKVINLVLMFLLMISNYASEVENDWVALYSEVNTNNHIFHKQKTKAPLLEISQENAKNQYEELLKKRAILKIDKTKGDIFIKSIDDRALQSEYFKIHNVFNKKKIAVDPIATLLGERNSDENLNRAIQEIYLFPGSHTLNCSYSIQVGAVILVSEPFRPVIINSLPNKNYTLMVDAKYDEKYIVSTPLIVDYDTGIIASFEFNGIQYLCPNCKRRLYDGGLFFNEKGKSLFNEKGKMLCKECLEMNEKQNSHKDSKNKSSNDETLNQQEIEIYKKLTSNNYVEISQALKEAVKYNIYCNKLFLNEIVIIIEKYLNKIDKNKNAKEALSQCSRVLGLTNDISYIGILEKIINNKDIPGKIIKYTEIALNNLYKIRAIRS